MSFPEAELARGVELDGAGFLPRRGESAEQFFRRVETILGIHREFEAELAAAGEVGVYGLQLRSQDRIPDEIIGEAEEVTDRLYSFRTRHVPGFFLSRDVGLLYDLRPRPSAVGVPDPRRIPQTAALAFLQPP